jgi:hypothetical protein
MSSASRSRQLSPSPLDGRRTPPPVAAAGRRRRSPGSAAIHRAPPPVTGLRRRSTDAAAGRLMRSTASAVAAGRQLSLSSDVPRSGQPLLPPSVSHTVDSPCCHCLLVLVNSPCCYLSPVNSPCCSHQCFGEQPLLLSQSSEQPSLFPLMFW